MQLAPDPRLVSRCHTVCEGGVQQSLSGLHQEHVAGCLGHRKDVCMHLGDIDDSFVITGRVDDYRTDDNELLPYEARSRNGSRKILTMN
jgi:hypothetical protein